MVWNDFLMKSGCLRVQLPELYSRFVTALCTDSASVEIAGSKWCTDLVEAPQLVHQSPLELFAFVQWLTSSKIVLIELFASDPSDG